MATQVRSNSNSTRRLNANADQRAVERVVVEAEVGCLAQAHLAQGGRHGPPSPGPRGCR
jgi:hypothetical protein